VLRIRLTSLLLLVALLAAPRAESQVAQSTFAASAEDWTNVTLPYPSAVPPTVLGSYAPQWVASLGGYIRLTDPDGSGQTGECQYWNAPDAFLGDRSAAYGGTLEFDLACTVTTFGPFHQEDILLVGDGLTLVYDLASVPTGSFAHYTVPFSETGWKKGDLAGPQPTAEEFHAVIATLSKLYIRAEHQLGSDVQFLDNVTLSAGTLDVEQGIGAQRLAVEPLSPNPSSRSVQVGFTNPHSGAGAVEVLDAAGRRVASLSAGTFERGSHALNWNGRDTNGRGVSAGVYWVRVRIGDQHATRALIRVR
jgi:hypothetical protein